MPLPKVKPNESQSDYMGRCMSEAFGSDAPEDRTKEQAIAMCMQAWRDRNKRFHVRQPEPEEDESRSDFLERCIEEMVDEEDMSRSDARDECEALWEERRSPPVMHKICRDDSTKGLEFILSDATPDRYGDIVTVEGWQLESFKSNPIALFSHDPKFIVGRWHNLRVENKALRGRLELAPAGTSARIDEIRKLVEAGILKAVSVGFKPLRDEPINAKDPYAGTRFLQSELVETSLVSVPANPNALAIAKSLNVSRDTMALVFAEHGKEGERTRSREYRAEHGRAKQASNRRAPTMLGQRIADTEALMISKKDELDAHWKSVDDSNVTEAQIETGNQLTSEIASLERLHASMLASEKVLAGTVSNGNGSRALTVIHDQRRHENGKGAEPEITSPAIIKQRGKDSADPRDYLWRGTLVGWAAKSWGKSPEEARAMIAKDYPVYGDDGTKAMCEYVLRAATAPAMTGVAGWAAELVQQVWVDPMPLLMPDSVLPKLAPRGLSLTFGRAGRINIPTRSRTPTIAGSFVAEGAAIPVRQGAFTSQFLVPKKLGVISTWTREMDLHSTPAIEGVIRQAIQEDTAVAVDSILLDANPATSVRPAGLLNGVAALTATAGADFNAVIGDIKKLTGALVTATYGNLRNLVWLMNPAEANSLRLTVAPATGVFPFREELAGGTLNGIPVIVSATVPVKTIILLDAADFVVATGDGPTFTISDQATIHEEDTTPLALATPGTPAVVAAPQRSLFQTDSLAIRMIMGLNWLMRRTGMVVWIQNVTW